MGSEATKDEALPAYAGNESKWDRLHRPTGGMRMSTAEGMASLEQAVTAVAEHELAHGDFDEIFKSHSREAAAAHEAAHAVVYAAEGFTVRKIELRRKLYDGFHAWGGLCHAGEDWRIDEDTPVPEILSRCRVIIAGRIGEQLALGNSVGSAVDEIAQGQILATMAARQLGADPEEVWAAVWSETRDILERNRDAHRRITAVLMHCGYKLANDGHDTRAIQHYLGHKNITSAIPSFRRTASEASGRIDQRKADPKATRRNLPRGRDLPPPLSGA